MSRRDVEDVLGVVQAWAVDNGVEHERGARPGEVVLQLPGEHKLATTVSLLVGDHSVSLSAFVIRHPDENGEAVLRYLLRRNARLHGVAFAVDSVDDVYLIGRLPLRAVDADSLDDWLGAVLATADSCFDELLALGFRGAMQKEWDWRTLRGEPVHNLQAFRHLLERPPDR